MLGPLIECVPNISEGRDHGVIERCARAVASVRGVHLLHLDTNPDAHRSVLTFVGPPAGIESAAIALAEATSTAIDMRDHRGAHPRIGGLDVLPLIPLAGIGVAECVALSERIGERLGAMGIPVYLYEQSARTPERRKLSTIRRGGYEGLEARLRTASWAPDFGPSEFNAGAGASVVGVRRILVAFNVGLASTDESLARSIASQIRADGPDSAARLPECRAIGWTMPAYGCVQVSTNLLRHATTGLAAAFCAIRDRAAQAGVRVLGSELIGLCPRSALSACGRALSAPYAAASLDDAAAIHRAVEELGLGYFRPFKVEDRVLELAVAHALGLSTEIVGDLG